MVGAVDDDAVALVYGDVRRGLDAVKRSSAGSIDAKDLEGVQELFDRQGLKTFAASFAVTSNSGKFKFASTTKDDGQGDAAAETVAALPAGS